MQRLEVCGAVGHYSGRFGVKGLRTLNKAPSTKLIQKNSLPSTAHESQLGISKNFTAHRNKNTQPVLKS
jgi:hypothetical protein